MGFFASWLASVGSGNAPIFGRVVEEPAKEMAKS